MLLPLSLPENMKKQDILNSIDLQINNKEGKENYEV